jgi:triosephosphate isomerase (TIM)
MNTTQQSGLELLEGIATKLSDNKRIKVAIAPPFTHLAQFRKQITAGNHPIALGAQNVHHKKAGAFTGEVSLPMLTEIGLDLIIIGHSERRQWNFETDEQLAEKLKLVTDDGIKAVFCLGEPIQNRLSGNYLDFLQNQLINGLFTLNASALDHVIVAYEPIWAIGTGNTAEIEQIAEVHAFIRKLLVEQYGNQIAGKTCILYGGSVNQHNAAEIMAINDVDGALVGGASLNVETFYSIIQAAEYASGNLV